MSTPRVVLSSRQNLMPEQARDARARAWAFVFQCWEEKQKGRPTTSGPDSAKGGSSDSSAKASIP